MRKLIVVLALAAAAGGCRDRDVDVNENGVDIRKTTEGRETADEDFVHTRKTYESHTRERLARIDAKLRELRERGEVKAEAAAEELREQRDKLAKQLDKLGEQAKPTWDRFESEVTKTFDDIENRLDAAFTRD